MKTEYLRRFIEARDRAANGSDFDDARNLAALAASAPEFCSRAIADSKTPGSLRGELVVALLTAKVNRERLAACLRKLPEAEMLATLDVIRAKRLNGRRARQLGLDVLLGHPRLAETAAHHRQRLIRLLKHLLGERTWSSVVRHLGKSSEAGERFLSRTVWRYAKKPSTAREALYFLAGHGIEREEPRRYPWSAIPWWNSRKQPERPYRDRNLRRSVDARRDLAAGDGMPLATLTGICGTYLPGVSRKQVRALAGAPPTRKRDDGPLTGALKRAYSGNTTAALNELTARHAGRMWADVPAVALRAAVVLDLSGSMISSGERLFHPAALGLAIVGLLQRRVTDMSVFQVGGSKLLNGDGLPRPRHESDIATAVIAAARAECRSILIVTDGYENHRRGDTAQVVQGLRQLGTNTDVLQVTPVVSAAEDLTRRQLGANIPVVPISAEYQAGELAVRLLLAAAPHELEPVAVRTVDQLLFGSAV